MAGVVEPPAPPSEATRVEVDALARELAGVEALLVLERSTLARDAAIAALARAEQLGDAPSLARARLARARVALLDDLPEDALPLLESAAMLAGGGVHAAIEREAALAAMTERGARWLDRGEAQRWRRVVVGLLAQGEAGHADARGRLEARLALADVHVALAERELVHARERLADVDDAVARLDAGDPLRLELGLAAVAVERELGQLVPARAHADALVDVATREHPGTPLHAAVMLAHAEVCLAAGELAAAAASADAAMRMLVPGRSRRHDHARAAALGLAGRIAAAAGDPAAAETAFERAAALAADEPVRAWPGLWRGELALARGNTAAGLVAIDDALAGLDVALAPDDARRLPLLEFAARALLDAGELRWARVVYALALALVDRRLGACPRRALLLRELGELELRAGDPAAAREHLDAAHVMLAGGLGLRHPIVVRASLARADLAWQLGERDDAASLYRVLIRDLDALAEHEAAARARLRAALSE